MPPVPLSNLRHLFLDMDGTVYLGSRLIPGAPEFVAYLRESGRRYLFFTNNPSADAAQYSAKLAGMGIDAGPDNILTAGEATARYLAGDTPYRKVYVLGTPSFEEELCAAGLVLDGDSPDAVVLAFDKTLTYGKLERACLLLRAGIPYIATNPDKVCPTDYGPIPDCGSMAALLFEATGRRPKVIGKPNPEMIAMGMQKIGARAGTSAMVGDRLYTDMQMAYNAGIASILVLSGESAPGDLEGMARRPDFVFESVRGLHAALVEADRA
ncbi:MAG: HAD-IIA family hydrolase [Candidatus Hydrogenedentes bacterium]|nr:HAD-IIA family hydrolase [Candidatus Hydrogenedentota bacterium]